MGQVQQGIDNAAVISYFNDMPPERGVRSPEGFVKIR
jgi:hypothetical protein